MCCMHDCVFVYVCVCVRLQTITNQIKSNRTYVFTNTTTVNQRNNSVSLLLSVSVCVCVYCARESNRIKMATCWIRSTRLFHSFVCVCVRARVCVCVCARACVCKYAWQELTAQDQLKNRARERERGVKTMLTVADRKLSNTLHATLCAHSKAGSNSELMTLLFENWREKIIARKIVSYCLSRYFICFFLFLFANCYLPGKLFT